jgi:NTE family protein
VPPLLRPDVLVLAAGGVVGEAWMTGVLAGIEAESDIDFRQVEALVGTSAGSIVSASLAAGRRPRKPDPKRGATRAEQAFGEQRAQERRGGLTASAVRAAARLGGTVTAPFAPSALRFVAPGGALARAALLSRVPDGGRPLTELRREVDRWGARFDGRLRVCAVDRSTGRRVVFGAPGSPPATVAEAVEASCAVPWVFRPVTIGDRTYVDGGTWSLTNLDAAPVGRDTHVLCLSVTTGRAGAASPAAMLRAAARPAIAVEIAAVRRRGAHVKLVGPDTELGGNLLDPRGAPAALAAGFEHGRRVAGG